MAAPQSPGPAPSYYISTVQITNFKSYSGTHELSLHPAFTAVIGPNGCGKSNLIEALIFAMGEKTDKLRQNSLINLIHASSRPKNTDFASVSITFQENFGQNQSIITRRLKETKSMYEINGKKASLSEVQSHCECLGIDIARNRFMVLQGEVEMLATMPATCGYEDESGVPISKIGLLEYFDEIIGTKHYFYRIKTTEKDIAEMGERIPRLAQLKDDCFARKSSYLNPLRVTIKQFRRMLKRFQMINVSSQVDLYVETRKHKELLTDKRNCDDDKRRTEEEMLESKRKLQVVMTVIEDLTRKVASMRVAMQNNADNIVNFEGQLSEFKQQYTKKLISAREHERLQSNLRKESLHHSEKLSKSTLDVSDYDNQLKFAETELLFVENELKSVVYDPNILKLQAELAPLIESQRGFEEEIRLIEQKTTILEGNLRENMENREKFRQERKENEERMRDLAQNIEKIHGHIHEKEKVVQTVAKVISELRSKLETVENTHRAALQSLKATENLLEKCQKSAKKQSSNQSFHFHLKSVISSGSLPGIYGRLGDLGSIPGYLDIAVSTLYHSQLDCYVAATVESAEVLVEYVKRQQLGVVTILVLDKIPAERRAFDAPHRSVPRIFDLISVKNEAVSKAFYSVFRDTLIANDLETARRVAFGGETRWNVATLQGELVRADGAMQGSARGKKGAMQLNDGVTEVERRENLEELEGQCKEMRENIKDLEGKSAKIKGELYVKEKEKQQEEIARLRLMDKLELAKVELEALQNEVFYANFADSSTDELTIAQIARSKRDYSVKNSQLSDILASKDGILSRINDLKPASVLELERKVTMLKSNRDLIEVQTIDKRSKLKKVTEYGATIEEKLRKIEAKMSEFDSEIRFSQIHIDDLQRKLSISQSKRDKYRSKLESKQKSISTFEQQQPELRSDFDKLDRKYKQILESLSDVEKQIRYQSKLIASLTSQIASNRGEYHRSLEEFAGLLQGLVIEKEIAEGDSEGEKAFFMLESKRLSKDVKSRYLFDIDEDLTIDRITRCPSRLKADISETITDLDSKLSQGTDYQIIADFRSISIEIATISQELAQIYDLLHAKRLEHEQMRLQRLTEFRAGCDVISTNLKAIYGMFTDTGAAEIECYDAADPFLGGIYISVRPPGKSWKKLATLSGGERTLVSLAMMFALHEYKPNGVYVMDEIDASLDYINVLKVANFIRNRKSTAQFIVVSLRSQMFEKADQLIGVYKPKDCSYVISIRPAACFKEEEEEPTDPIIRNTKDNLLG